MILAQNNFLSGLLVGGVGAWFLNNALRDRRRFGGGFGAGLPLLDGFGRRPFPTFGGGFRNPRGFSPFFG